MKASDVVGTWELVSFARHEADGSVSYPMGEDAVGRITYTPTGYMHAILMRRGRKKFSTANIFGVDDAERLDAADRFTAYCGTYEIKDGTVYHHTELSFYPNWEGEALPRRAKLEGGLLHLSPPPVAGQSTTSTLSWRRTKS
jgi:hypothetical protein